jgi:hypothetical protein
MPSSTAVTQLPDPQLAELLRLVKASKTVELKLTVPDADRGATVQALRLDPIDAQIRQVLFFDTPELSLNEAGVVVRARRIQGGRADTVVKLRPVVPEQLPKKLRRSPSLGVEVDVMPGGFVCSASFKALADATEVREVHLGSRKASSLFSDEQQAFFREHAPEGIEIDDLAVLGPILVLKLKFKPAELERRMVAELWLYPDASTILELSTKCLPDEAFLVGAETRAFLTERGVDLTGEQRTKTKTALQFFSSRLRATAGPG